MARVLQMWRWGVFWLMIMMIPVCVYVVLNSGHFESEAATVQASLEQIPADDLKEVTVPLAIKQILPVGVIGLLCAVMAAAAISTDDTYMHSWGSVFIQDVVLPLRKKRLTPQQHIKWLRWSILSVAIFGWVFSMVFPLKEFIFMYLQITGAIFLGGAGAVIIGGLYWKRATTPGAWAGMITGLITAVAGILINNIIWPFILPAMKVANPNSVWLQELPQVFPFNGMQLAVFSALISIVIYIIVSLVTRPDPDFDMDRMLHRGKYAQQGEVQISRQGFVSKLKELFGISAESTKGDKFICSCNIIWVMFWFVTFVIGTVYNLAIGDVSDDSWANWWLFYILVFAVVGIITIVWFLWGGFRDMFAMLKMLSTIKRNELDDGTVVEHHNIADETTAND